MKFQKTMLEKICKGAKNNKVAGAKNYVMVADNVYNREEQMEILHF